VVDSKKESISSPRFKWLHKKLVKCCGIKAIRKTFIILYILKIDKWSDMMEEQS